MTGRRAYRLGKRASSVAATKRRILAAATDEYAENGIEGTSMQAVARRAGVAAGTVLYHYRTPDALAEAALAAWTEVVALPQASEIDAAAEPGERIRQFVRAMFALYTRADWVYEILQKSPDYPPLVAARDEWERTAGEMMAAALGESAGDIEAIQVISSLVDPGFWVTLRSRGINSERAVDTVSAMAADWLEVPRPRRSN